MDNSKQVSIPEDVKKDVEKSSQNPNKGIRKEGPLGERQRISSS